MTDTLVQNANVEILTVLQLREICREKGIKGYSKMTKAELIGTVQTTIPVQNLPEPPAAEPSFVIQTSQSSDQEEEDQNWENSFIDELKKVCLSLDDLPETQFLPEDLNHLINFVTDATSAQIADLSHNDILKYMDMINNDLPRYQLEVYETIKRIAKASPVYVDVDFV